MMKAARAEALLTGLYTGSAILSVVSLTCVAICWQYWARTLDICIGIDCGCILYGINAFGTFMGGDAKICHFASFGLIPVIATGSFLAIYHGYRSYVQRNMADPGCYSATQLTTHDDRNRLEERVVIVKPKNRSPCKQWTSAAFFAALLSCLSLAHAIVITDGYYKTCDRYRRQMTQLLGSSGREIQVIHDRLPCGAIFDFMDYLQPDAHNWRRGDEINTGLTLQFALVGTWLNFFAWILIFAINFDMARRRHRALGEKLCCCC